MTNTSGSLFWCPPTLQVKNLLIIIITMMMITIVMMIATMTVINKKPHTKQHFQAFVKMSNKSLSFALQCKKKTRKAGVTGGFNKTDL